MLKRIFEILAKREIDPETGTYKNRVIKTTPKEYEILKSLDTLDVGPAIDTSGKYYDEDNNFAFEIKKDDQNPTY